MADMYYTLSLQVNGASTPAYYSITPTSNLTMLQGAASIAPSAAQSTMVALYPQTLNVQSPAGRMTASATIVTSESSISGRLLISPAVNVPVTLTLYGAGGQLGQQTYDPGSTGGVFDFPVSGGGFANAEEARAAIEKMVPAAEPPAY